MTSENIRFSRRFKTTILILFPYLILVLYGCRNNDLNYAFRTFHLSKYGIEYPSDQEDLNNCIARRLDKCIELYEAAKEGKRIILSAPPSVALDYALATIQSKCLSDEPFELGLCEGAIVSLYFFPDAEQDKVILNAFKGFSPALLSTVFGGSSYIWFGNRPQPELWEQFIESLPDTAFPRLTRQHIIDLFNSSTPVRKHGVLLL